ncbi:MAG: PrsW family intramembrane metalloprotease [Candidatus Nomurabacteria bacterium]|nr:PrsW family intramembrane metalloprotease [Candidatus Nomurabacteria bacterium]
MEFFGSIPWQTWVWAFIGGVIPTFFWLWFWLRYDQKHPEPKGLLFLVFLGGALSTMIALPLQNWLSRLIVMAIPFTIALAFSEELIKYIFARVIALRTKFFDEPRDAVVYLVTAALGFAAIENALYLLDPLINRDIGLTIATGNLRFIGATVLHTVGAGILGLAIGLAFYKPKLVKFIHFLGGIIAATAVHALFNYFIDKNTQESFIITFGVLWITLITTVLLFTKLRNIRPRRVV